MQKGILSRLKRRKRERDGKKTQKESRSLVISWLLSPVSINSQ